MDVALVAHSAPARVVEQVLFALQLALLGSVALSWLLPPLTGGASWTYYIGGILAIVCVLESLAISAFLGVTRDKRFFANGGPQTSLVGDYIARTRRPVDFVFLFLILSAIAGLVWFYASGTLGSVVSAASGHYFVTVPGHGKREITLAEFQNLAVVKDIGTPATISVIFASATSLTLRSARDIDRPAPPPAA
jgi:hypothetical protein